MLRGRSRTSESPSSSPPSSSPPAAVTSRRRRGNRFRPDKTVKIGVIAPLSGLADRAGPRHQERRRPRRPAGQRAEEDQGLEGRAGRRGRHGRARRRRQRRHQAVRRQVGGGGHRHAQLQRGREGGPDPQQPEGRDDLAGQHEPDADPGHRPEQEGSTLRVLLPGRHHRPHPGPVRRQLRLPDTPGSATSSSSTTRRPTARASPSSSRPSSRSSAARSPPWRRSNPRTRTSRPSCPRSSAPTPT